MKIRINKVFVTGLAIGLLAVVLQVFFRVVPPEANGICLIGHPRDVVSLIMNNLFSLDWPLNESFIIYPTLTAMGVILGSFYAARNNQELAIQTGPVRQKFSAFMFGFLVINFGLFWGACPIRTSLLISYGNLIALAVLASIAVGVFLAVVYVKFRVRRQSPK